jgi:hypothetical protein
VTDQPVFVDLPASLVEEAMDSADEVAGEILATFQSLKRDHGRLRAQLEETGLVIHESTLDLPAAVTTCGVDGSYAVERLLATDLVACAGVAVEGLTPPSETRHWALPHHCTFIQAERHNEATGTILRALMMGYELELAYDAPHDVVMFDGSLTLPVIYFNPALTAAAEARRLNTSDAFIAHAAEWMFAYAQMLQAGRTDKQYVGMPKYTTHREVGSRLGWDETHDDRGLLSSLLHPGELTRPQRLHQPSQEWHLNALQTLGAREAKAREYFENAASALAQVHVLYYRPAEWMPALRVELPAAIAHTPVRLAMVIGALKQQCAAPGMFEPFPLYMADRMVKSLARSVPAFRQVATQRIAELYEGDMAEVFFGMHGYRTESGR